MSRAALDLSEPVMVRWIWACGFGLAVIGAPPARADDPDPIAILKAVNARTRAVTSVKYDLKFYGIGSEKDSVTPVSGTVITRADPDGGTPLLLMEVRSVNEQTPLHQTVAFDGETRVRINWIRRTVDKAPARYRPMRESWRRQPSGWTMAEFTHPTPFDDEINGREARYEGRTKVGGVECHVITVTYQAAARARWYFGVEDNLPHRVDRLRSTDDDSSALVTELSHIDTSPIIDQGTFSVLLPKGFAVRETRRDSGRSDRRLGALLEVGREAPRFELSSTAGKSIVLHQLRGRVVLLSFWNSWAEPCKRSLPVIEDLAKKYAEDPVTVVGINAYEDEGVNVGAVARQRGMTYPCVIDDGQVARQYRVAGVPVVYVINHEGAVAYGASGSLDAAELSAAIDAALDKVR